MENHKSENQIYEETKNLARSKRLVSLRAEVKGYTNSEDFDGFKGEAIVPMLWNYSYVNSEVPGQKEINQNEDYRASLKQCAIKVQNMEIKNFSVVHKVISKLYSLRDDPEFKDLWSSIKQVLGQKIAKDKISVHLGLIKKLLDDSYTNMANDNKADFKLSEKRGRKKGTSNSSFKTKLSNLSTEEHSGYTCNYKLSYQKKRVLSARNFSIRDIFLSSEIPTEMTVFFKLKQLRKSTAKSKNTTKLESELEFLLGVEKPDGNLELQEDQKEYYKLFVGKAVGELLLLSSKICRLNDGKPREEFKEHFKEAVRFYGEKLKSGDEIKNKESIQVILYRIKELSNIESDEAKTDDNSFTSLFKDLKEKYGKDEFLLQRAIFSDASCNKNRDVSVEELFKIQKRKKRTPKTVPISPDVKEENVLKSEDLGNAELVPNTFNNVGFLTSKLRYPEFQNEKEENVSNPESLENAKLRTNTFGNIGFPTFNFSNAGFPIFNSKPESLNDATSMPNCFGNITFPTFNRYRKMYDDIIAKGGKIESNSKSVPKQHKKSNQNEIE